MIAAGLVLMAMLVQGPEADLRAHYEAARAAQRSGDLGRAAEEYRQVVRLVPEMAEAHANLGLLELALGRVEESVGELQTAERLKPGLAGVSLSLGIGYARLNRARDAVPYLEKAVAQEPGRKEAHTWLASALWDAGEHARALEELERTAALFPSDPDCVFLLGEGYRKSAATILERLVGEDPALARQIRAETYAAEGRWDRAARHYDELCRMRPEDREALRGLVAALVAQGKQAEADRAAEALPAGERTVRPEAFVAGLPAHSTTVPAEARARFNQRDYPGAMRVLRGSPVSNGAAQYLLARCYERLAVETLARLVALDPESYRVHQLMGELAEAREKYEEALGEYRAVEKIRPSLAGIHYSIGNVLWRLRRSEEAVAELQKELAANPRHAAANAELGTIYVREHEPEKAVEPLTRALAVQPDLPAARKELGKAFFQMRRYADAARELKLALSPDADGSAHYILGTVYREMGNTVEAARAFAEARRRKGMSVEEEGL